MNLGLGSTQSASDGAQCPLQGTVPDVDSVLALRNLLLQSPDPRQLAQDLRAQLAGQTGLGTDIERSLVDMLQVSPVHSCVSCWPVSNSELARFYEMRMCLQVAHDLKLGMADSRCWSTMQTPAPHIVMRAQSRKSLAGSVESEKVTVFVNFHPFFVGLLNFSFSVPFSMGSALGTEGIASICGDEV